MDYNFKVDQPSWLLNEINLGEQFETVESRMSLVIEMSELNVDQRTGGPLLLLYLKLKQDA